MPVVDLSLDFDFFVREDVRWDFGHGESGIFSQMAHILWMTRYQGVALYEETRIENHADFRPRQLAAELRRKGLWMPFREGNVGIADSHERAFAFFAEAWEKTTPPDHLVSLDAHHDLFTDGPLDCGNWLYHLLQKHPDFDGATVVYPGWKDPEIDGTPVMAVPTVRWGDWGGIENARVRNIFLCRSPGWVPPHHDDAFTGLCADMIIHANTDFEGMFMHTMYERPAPSEEKAAEMYRTYREWLEDAIR